MNEIFRVKVREDLVANRNMVIVLRKDAKDILTSIAGKLPDYRWWTEDNDSNVKEFLDVPDPWGWTLWHDGENDQDFVILWFKDPRHAIYFKTLWGGM
jgi:hypothetical protein